MYRLGSKSKSNRIIRRSRGAFIFFLLPSGAVLQVDDFSKNKSIVLAKLSERGTFIKLLQKEG